jgi:hypothetical protein
MEIQPLCSVPGCGSLGLYRCSDCSRVFCAQHAVILSETSERGVAGLWLVHCHTCRIQASNLASLGSVSQWNEPPWAGATPEPASGGSQVEREPDEDTAHTP